MKPIVIIDYGLGNPASIKNMIKKIGGDSVISSSHSEIEKAGKLILPGVGHFGKAMELLTQSGLKELLEIKVVSHGIPILGICLGMQLMTTFSEEGDSKGLNWISGTCKRFNFESTNLKIPHMGWTEVRPEGNHLLFKSEFETLRYYFVHSYFVECDDPANVIGRSDYGHEFVSAISKGNIMGVQFHPEKSHKYGMRIMKNFLDM